jgi:predicted Rossmann-fold nucleotide-binding protein
MLFWCCPAGMGPGLNVAGYYDPLLAMADSATAEGFVRYAHRQLLLSDDDPERLLDRLSGWS